MKKYIDLRSDTVTQPSQFMLDELVKAPLGDDVFIEDPTVNKLEENAAQLLGTEKALLVPSGTMGNLIAILVHCPRGTEVILGDCSHTFIYEAGGISAFGGIHSHQLKNELDGTMKIESIENAIRQDNVHFPRTSLISLENTQNMCFGAPLGITYMNDVYDLSNKHGFCFASNGWFAKRYDVTDVTVSNWISKLKACKYIQISYNPHRRIFVPRLKGDTRGQNEEE